MTIDIEKVKGYYYKTYNPYLISEVGNREMHNAFNELERLQKKETTIKPLHVMQTYQCLGCEKEIRETWLYCPYCGVKLDWSDEK